MAVGCVKIRWHPQCGTKANAALREKNMMREWPPWCSKLCRLTSENDVTPWEFCSTMLTAAIVMAPRSLIKTESRTTSRCGIRRFTQCQGKKLSNQPANEWPPIFALLLFASLSFQHDLAAVVFPFHVTNLKLSRYNTFFLQSIRTVWSSIWSSTVEVPAALQVTTVCRVPSTCKDRMWDKCYGRTPRLALFTASLTKKCV